MSRILGFLAIVGMVVTFGCGTSTRLEVPTPEPSEFVDLTLTSLFATSTTDIFVAGYLTRRDGSIEGIILQTGDGGDDWKRIGAEIFDFRDLNLQWIYFNDVIRGWAAGVRLVDDQTIPVVIRTGDGGGHWREARIPQSRNDIVDQVGNLHFKTDDEGTAHVRFFDANGEINVNVFETLDGGRNWIIKDFKQSPDDDVTDPIEMMVSVKEGFRLAAPLPNGTQILEFTGDGGKNWVPFSQFHVTQIMTYY